jgi:predicted nucleic acid-binding protein
MLVAAVYLDSSVVIPLVQGTADQKSRLASRLTELAGDDPVHMVSDLVRLECWVKPLADGNDGLLRDFDAFFALPEVACVSLTTAVCRQAALVRAKRRYRTPDALHLAAAIEAGCDSFATGDARLADFPHIRVVLLRPT